DVEVARFLVLTKSTIDPVTLTLPRTDKLKQYFQDDVYGVGWEYGETFGVGDTVGCSFVNNASVVFTRNGQVAGPPIPCAPSSPMYPIVGVDSPDAIEWNFGHKPFAFDGLALEDTPLDDADVLWEEESCDEVQDESSIGEGLEYYTFALDDDDDEWDDEFVYHEDEDDLEYDEPSEYEDDMEPMEE
ncbi:hypothetical protein DYB26_015662, partial [Aphanomyces astaci]